jgi:hypothetical protein
MMKSFRAFPLLFLFLCKISPAQYYTTGTDPASIHWRQINTPGFRLIYPVAFEKQSQYLANIMEIVVRSDTHSLKAKVPRIPIVIHQQSAISNGVTVWAPKRIELYPCPPQDIYGEEWLEQLAIHEYRHAVQTSKMNRGFTKILYYIFGEQITGGVLGLYIPGWFLEGDAVATETALSSSGRGRLAGFESTLRAQLLEKGQYSYDKAVLGSYKTFVPDYYSLGYFLVAKTREKYGTVLWNSALDKTARYPFMVIPFNSGIKKITGLSKVKLYRQTLSEMDSSWSRQASGITYTERNLITKPDPKNFSLYQFPIHYNDSTIISEKNSLDDIDRFFLISRRGREKKLFTPGFYSNQSLSAANNLLVWAEAVPDIRWNNRDYSIIKVYDIKKKKIRSLTKRSRYFAPAISRDGTKVTAVHVTLNNESSVDILDIDSGKLLKTFSFGTEALAITPSWDKNGSKITLTLLTESGKCIGILDLSTGVFTQYVPYNYDKISGRSLFYKHYLMFTADYSGIENICAVDTLTRQIWQVTSSQFGARNPDFSDGQDKMIYSETGADGSMIVETIPDTARWTILEDVRDHSIKLYNTLVTQENINIQDSVLHYNIFKMIQDNGYDLAKDSIRGRLYKSKKYSKVLHLFNAHSWAPASIDVNNLMVHPGVSVLSQNVLSSMVASAGYDYNINEGEGKFFANLSYQGLYPVFDLNFTYGGRSSYYMIRKTGEIVPFKWNEMNFTGTVSIPWNFTHGKYYRFVTPFVGTSLIDVIHTSETPSFYTNGLIQSMNYRLYAANYIRSNPKDMSPKWGQTLDFNFRNTPFQGNSMGSIISVATNLYFPGFFNHHSFRIYGGIQGSEINPYSFYRFSDMINYPRGFTGQESDQLYSVSFNYQFPLFYPDFSLGSLLYFKRFKLNIFYDFGEGTLDDDLSIYKSTGAELMADLHILRFPLPVQLGVRSMYFPGTQSWGFQFLYSINY